MKINTLKFSVARLYSLIRNGFPAQSVSSTPVGYVTYTVNANSDLKLGIPMEQASSFAGSVSSVTLEQLMQVQLLVILQQMLINKVTSGTLAGTGTR